MLFKDQQRSCAAAVARIIAWLTASGQKAPSANTGAYCKLRDKLTEGFLRRLARECAEGAEELLPRNGSGTAARSSGRRNDGKYARYRSSSSPVSAPSCSGRDWVSRSRAWSCCFPWRPPWFRRGRGTVCRQRDGGDRPVSGNLGILLGRTIWSWRTAIIAPISCSRCCCERPDLQAGCTNAARWIGRPENGWETRSRCDLAQAGKARVDGAGVV